MKWPWVSRERLDEMAAEWRVQRAFHAADQKRFDVLLERYHSLRLEGYSAPPTVTPRTQKETDPLTQAVLDASKGKPPAIRNAMMKQLNEDRKAVELGHMEIGDVLRRIENGFTPDDGIPE